MKKLIFSILFLIAFRACAQYSAPIKTAFNAGFDLGIPQNSIYSIGLGFSGEAEFPVTNKLCVTITPGYDVFFYKGSLFETSETPSPAVFVPVKAGAKYYFSEEIYAESEVGTVIEANYLRQDLFAFSIGPGFIFPVNDKHNVEIGLRYESWSGHQLQQTAIRFAYRFGGGSK